MSLDNIQLSPFLIGELYKNSLVDTDGKQLNASLLKADELLFLGKNQKNILVMVNEENAVYLPDDDLNFLVDILTACKLSLSDIALINFFKNSKANYNTLMEKFRPAVVLFFGIEPAKLEFPLQFPHYQVQQYNHQVYLSSPSLNELANDKQKKMQLWASLKKLFLT
jgi:DNA polymerase III psi subunit